MNRGYSYTSRGLARSPTRKDRLPDPSRSSNSRNQANMKQDVLNIDDFGDMGSDEDDFQALSSNFFPPKPPSRPQYNLVPYGLLRDDDELIEEDYDGVPVDDSSSITSQDSPKKQPWRNSPVKSKPQEMRGNPITVLGSNRSEYPLTQDSLPRNRPGLGSSSVDSNIGTIRDNSSKSGAGRWDVRNEPAGNINLGNDAKTPSSMGMGSTFGNARNFVRPQKETFIPSADRQRSGFVRAVDDANPFMKKPTSSGSTPSFGRGTDDPVFKMGSIATSSIKAPSFVRSTDDSNPFIKTGSKPSSSGSALSFIPSNDSKTFFQSRDSTTRRRDDPKPDQNRTPVWSEKGTESQSLKAQAQPVLPNIATSTASQLEILQAAALQQALSGLTQLGSQSGLNLIGAQNLLLQAVQNPTLAAALVGSGSLLNTGLGSVQPSTSNNPTAEALLKSVAPAAPPNVTSNVGLLTYPLRSNVTGKATPHKKSIPDGSGATRYPAPDVSSLVFDPSTGYRYDDSTGLHYDANSGYFFNSALKVYLRWDKFTQTYLKVDNPPGVSRFIDSSITPGVPYLKDSRLPLHGQEKQSSRFLSSPFSRESILSSNTNSSGNFIKESQSVLAPTMNVATSSNTLHSVLSSIPTDFSKPPPSLPQSFLSGPGPQQLGASLSNVQEPKAAVLPNFAETSLFNKLRKAKLAQTAQKADQKRWGSPDPLIEATRTHVAETSKSDDSVLNLNEILQRSRQFMKQKSGNEGDDTVGANRKRAKSRSPSGDRRKVRSRSIGRPSIHSRSPEKLGNRRGRSPPSRRPAARSPVGRRPYSRGRSPNSKARGKPSLSPEARKKRSASTSRSPINRARDESSPLPDSRLRRPPSRGRSPLRRRKRSSKSPDPKQRRPVTRSPERRPGKRSSVSPDLKKRIYQPRTPNRSVSPKVKIVLDQSPGGSKIRISPGRNSKRPADRGLSAERKKRKLSPSSKSPERRRALSPDRRATKGSVDENTGLVGRNSSRPKSSNRDPKKENLEKDKITELKPIPYDKSHRKKSSDKSRHVSGYKSLSNLRNQGKGNSREEPQKIQSKSATSKPQAEANLTADSDDKQSRNHRLVSERTFSSGWERKKPHPVLQGSVSKKPDTPSDEDLKERREDEGDKEETDNKESNADECQLDESNDFDFLNDTLDDDKESTVVDEDEEILDYEDLERTTELVGEESASNESKLDSEALKKLESAGSPVVDLDVNPEEHIMDASMSRESHVESVQNSSVEPKELLVDSGTFDDKNDEAATRNNEDAEKGLGVDDGIDGTEVRNSEHLEVARKSESESAKVPESVCLKDNCVGIEGIKEPGIPKVETSEPPDSKKSSGSLPTQDETAENKSGAGDECKALEAVGNSEKLGSGMIETDNWNVVDSLDDQAEVTEGSIPPAASEEKRDVLSQPVSTDHSPLKSMDRETFVVKDEVGASAGKAGDSTDESRLKVENNEPNQGGVVHKEPESPGEQIYKTSDDHANQINVVEQSSDEAQPSGDQTGEGINSNPTEKEGVLLQVRSVSDIEKFLLLSSQEVEAKREQSMESTGGKNDKKSGVFSRLGEKLSADEAGGEPTVVLELPPEPLDSAAGTSKTTTSSPAKPKPATKAKPSTSKAQKIDAEDPVGMLFDDTPTCQILIGPMNFIEPRQNFQQFTQRYMQILLKQENVKVRKVYVYHEDVTGAPYHYILVMFHNARTASEWFKKHKGIFKSDEKVFKRVAGHLKHKFIHTETFMHFSEINWICKVCKKGNFPPRSLCFGCFQHKDPEGFSPLMILDKGPPPYRHSNFVGTPKLKFFVTKEKVIASAPPLDGFDIKNMEIIMDEKMGFPAGICVFEMYNYIDAGKLKKFLNHREIEAVSVEMNERPVEVNPSPKETSPTESDGRLSDKLSVSRHKHLEEREGLKGQLEDPGIRERSPRAPSRDARVPRGRSPSPSREVRAPRRSPSGTSTRKWIPRARSPSSPRRAPRGRSPSPSRRRISRDRVLSRSPRRVSPGYRPRSRSPRQVHDRPTRGISRGRVREGTPLDSEGHLRRYSSPKRLSGHRSPRYRSPGYVSPSRRSRSPRYRSPSRSRPVKPDGRSSWVYPPPDPKNFKFEPRSGLDYDSTTTLYYEPKSCCFYNDDTNEWMEYDPRTGRYILVR